MDKSKWKKLKSEMKTGWKEAAAAEPKEFSDMPEGIKNGKAKLTDIDIRDWTNEQGDVVPVVDIIGSIIEPSEHKGKRIVKSHFLCDSNWGTFQDAQNSFFCDLKTIGFDVASESEIDGELDRALSEGREYIFDTYRTKKGKGRVKCSLKRAEVPTKKATKKKVVKDEAPSEDSDWTEEDPFN